MVTKKNKDRLNIADNETVSAPMAPQTVTTTFVAFVEYVYPGHEMYESVFDWVNSGYRLAEFGTINSCRGISTESREVVFEYVHLNRDATAWAVLAEMDHLGLRPALFPELLAFAVKYPDEQRKFRIVALGSIMILYDRRWVAYLGEDDHERDLDLSTIVGIDWSMGTRFLAVRK